MLNDPNNNSININSNFPLERLELLQNKIDIFTVALTVYNQYLIDVGTSNESKFNTEFIEKIDTCRNTIEQLTNRLNQINYNQINI